MRITARHVLGFIIVFILLLLALGIDHAMYDLPEEPKPSGYTRGFWFVLVACVMGVLFDLLLILLIAWHRTGKQADAPLPDKRLQSSLGKYFWVIYWVIFLICGWVGAFWAVIGIAFYGDWIKIQTGIAILIVACAAAYQASRKSWLTES